MTIIQLALAYFLIFLFGVFPVVLAGVIELMGKYLGGQDVNGNPPARWGISFGKGSNGMVIMGWLALITGPLAIAAALAVTYYWWQFPVGS
ncbi:MAG: hypothetical protein AB8H12_17570 [Lewinella sp.]